MGLACDCDYATLHGVRGPFADTEVSSFEDDKLGRVTFARSVAERIVRSAGGPSTVFGLAGKWGSGKTSTLNFISSIIMEEHGEGSNSPQKWSVVACTPWSSTDIEALTDEFYRAIATAMPNDPSGHKAKTLLAKAAPFAAAVGKAAVNALVDRYIGDDAFQKMASAGAESIADEAADEAAKFTAEQPTFMQRFDAISKAIKRAGRNVLVIIDDIDRLHGDELLGVMKAVRLLGRFDRVHYLLAYDDATVLDVLEGTDLARDNRDRARLYLEKIIQYPFDLPPIQAPQLQSELKVQLARLAENYALPLKIDSKGWDAAVARIISNTPSVEQLTLRNIYRWCNQLDILLALVGPQELDFADAALITYLRLWHKDLYRALPGWQSDLVDSYRDNRHDLTVDQWTARIASVLKDANDRAAPESICSFLSALFPRIRQSSNVHGLAINDREYFHRYFTLGFPLGDVRDLTIRHELQTLATTGALDSSGWLVGGIADPAMRYFVSNKATREADVISNATAESAKAAAHELARLLHESDLMGSPYGHLVYLLLRHAVAQAPDLFAAKKIIDQFGDEFGLVAATGIFYRKVREPTAADEAMQTASAGLREAIYEACVADLTTSIGNDNPAALTILKILWYLDDELWARLRDKAAQLLKESDTTLADLGARFVVIQPSAFGGSMDIHEFRAEEFKALVPTQEWAKYYVPPIDEDQVDARDPSLPNKIAYAAVRLRSDVEVDDRQVD
jgi:hypothetical protein